MANARTTTDHAAIRNWAEKRNGHPAKVRGTGRRNDPGMLRIDFPGYSGEDTLEEISWDDFFKKFDESELAFLYQEEAGDGEQSRFCKFVDRNTV
jgi:hypothetical protein